jgi:hypothetical protein
MVFLLLINRMAPNQQNEAKFLLNFNKNQENL